MLNFLQLLRKITILHGRVFIMGGAHLQALKSEDTVCKHNDLILFNAHLSYFELPVFELYLKHVSP